MHHPQASPLTALHIKGVHNSIATFHHVPSEELWRGTAKPKLIFSPCSIKNPPRTAELLTTLPHGTRSGYAHDFDIADDRFRNGHVAVTTSTPAKYWRHWQSYVQHLQLEPHHLPPDRTNFRFSGIRTLIGFVSQVRQGYYGHGHTITAANCTTAITGIGQMITMDSGTNPSKPTDSNKLHPQISQMINGSKKEDLPSIKKVPVKVDLPEEVAKQEFVSGTSNKTIAVGQIVLIASISSAGWENTQQKACAMSQNKHNNFA